MVLRAREHTQSSELDQEILHLQPGDHLCLFYDENPAEQLPALVPYIRDGLAANERCIYVADDFTLERLEAALLEAGIEVRSACDSGALVLWTRRQWRQSAELNNETKVTQVRSLIDDALAAGFKGVRFAIEMTWTLGPDITADRLRAWEALLNSIVKPGLPVRMICQYSRSRLPAEVVHAGLVTHPLAVVQDEVCANPYFEDPRAPEANSPPAAISPQRIDWMLSQLRRARAYERGQAQRRDAEDAVARATSLVRRRPDELPRLAAEKLRRANVVKDEFIGMVSHELRTPLTVILGNAQVLLKTLPIAQGPHRDALQDIRMEAERLRRVVTNLLSFAGNDGPPSIDTLSLSAIVRRVVQDHLTRFPQRRVITSYDDSDCAVLGNEGYIEQALGNLLINAERYSPRDTAIEVRIGQREQGWPSVTIADRGIGLGDADVERLFEPFYRAPSAAKSGPAVGIGLTVSKRLIEAQGGLIWAASRDGGGAEFSIALPRAAEPE